MSKKVDCGGSEQRYYHAVLLRPRRGTTARDLLDLLPGIGVPVHNARPCFDAEYPVGEREFTRFATIDASETFTGSEKVRAALGTGMPEGICRYDIVAGRLIAPHPAEGLDRRSPARIEFVATGYAALTRHLVGRLCREAGLLSTAWVLQPRLDELLKEMRGGGLTTEALAIRASGLRTRLPGATSIRGIQLSGGDVLESSLFEQIEGWARSQRNPSTSAPETDSGGGAGQASSEGAEGSAGTDSAGGAEGSVPGETGASAEIDLLQTTTPDAGLVVGAMRLSGVLVADGAGVAFRLSEDGSCSMWMRKRGVSIYPFMRCIGTVSAGGFLKASSEVPSWAEGSGV